MTNASPQIILCNGADLPQQRIQREPLVLEYRKLTDDTPNVRLDLPNFVSSVFHLPNRILDLLEIAAYIFCADRLISRGNKNISQQMSNTIAGLGYFTLSLKFGIGISGILVRLKKSLKMF